MRRAVRSVSALILLVLMASSVSAEPRLENISVYDVSQLSGTDRYEGGDLEAYGTNTTLQVDQFPDNREYRFQFRMTPPDNNWSLRSGDILRHENVSDSWTVNRIWYNISGTEYVGGTFSDRNVEWNTSKEGNVPQGENLYANYLVDVSQPSSLRLDQRFVTNDTSTSQDDIDEHILDLNNLGNLSVALSEPPNGTVLTQNRTFDLNSTITCSNGECGTIDANPRYNESTTADTLMASGSGEPFHTVGSNQGSCNLESSETCSVYFEVNATAADSTKHLLDVNTSSAEFPEIDEADSADTEVEVKQVVLLNLSWETTDFGLVDPGENEVPAEGNSNLSYNVTILENSNRADIWISATDLEAKNSDYFIGAGNMSFGLQNLYSSSEPLSSSYQLFSSSVAPGSVLNSFYWLDVPTGIGQDDYNGSMSFKANLSR